MDKITVLKLLLDVSDLIREVIERSGMESEYFGEYIAMHEKIYKAYNAIKDY